MFIDARIHNHPDYADGSISGAIRCLLDTLPLDGPVVKVEGLIDAKGNKVDDLVFLDVIKRVRGVGERFGTRRVLGALNVWKVQNAYDPDGEFSKPPKRKKWPFADMNVGDVIEIKYGEFGKSNPQTYAHTFGKQSGMRFKTSRNGAAYVIERTH